MTENGRLQIPGEAGSRFNRFQYLMRNRVREILLVSSLYDSYILSEDGSLYESLLNEYIGLGLTHMPNITRVSSGAEAKRLARVPGRFDLVITSLQLQDMHASKLSREFKQVGIETPIVLLTFDNRELTQLMKQGKLNYFDRVFVWQGDFRVVLAIIKFIEDRWNIAQDTELIGVQTIILVEDNVKFYSSYLPLIYTAVLEHTADLIAEGVNPAHRLLRMRARPKILLCSSYEEAWSYFERYHETILGVISDIEFPRNNTVDPEAGFALAEAVKARHQDIPVLLQSRGEENRVRAGEVGAEFLLKGSDTLLHEVKQFMIHHFGFGDFVFRLRDGTVVGRAHDLRSLEHQLYTLPDESLAYHGERNDFSTWLKARTEFMLAERLRPKQVTQFETITRLREYLIGNLREHRRDQQRGSVVDFDPDTFDEERSFARIGGGSLGGKARGVAFANALISVGSLESEFPDVRIDVPPSVILGTEVFDDFLEGNDLIDFAIHTHDDGELFERFRAAPLSEIIVEALSSYLINVTYPLSVRSSSLLEDSQFMPFAGVYETFMIPNNHADLDRRLEQLLDAIRSVYASTFTEAAKMYIKTTPYRLEEEKMAVIVQMLVGSLHEANFYPDVSGVARSHNFYPVKPMAAEDGIAAVALGLGQQVVEGGATVRFCPKYPRHLVQFSRVDDVLKYSQKDFFALEMPDTSADYDGSYFQLVVKGLDIAEADGTLHGVGSTYSHENHAIYDRIMREGAHIVTFAPILKHDTFPLPEIIDRLLHVGSDGMSGPVEIEFALKLGVDDGPREFYLLQMRPMVIDQELERLNVEKFDDADIICRSSVVLGNGAIGNVRDVVVVDIDRFSRADSMLVAKEVSLLNGELLNAHRPYILIGVGRWGSADPWLGVPVRWEDISGARVIVEAGMKDIVVTPSQGSHFFQNITASKVGYITVNTDSDGFIDWEWLAEQEPVRDLGYARHLRFDRPLSIFMDGHRNHAVIMKPGNDDRAPDNA